MLHICTDDVVAEHVEVEIVLRVHKKVSNIYRLLSWARETCLVVSKWLFDFFAGSDES